LLIESDYQARQLKNLSLQKINTLHFSTYTGFRLEVKSLRGLAPSGNLTTLHFSAADFGKDDDTFSKMVNMNQQLRNIVMGISELI
jgi:hypothetical protein